MKLTKQKLHEMIEEAITEGWNEDDFPGRTGYDLDFLKSDDFQRSLLHNPGQTDFQKDLEKMAFMHGARNKPLPKEYYKNKDVHAKWVEGKIEYDTWARSQGLPGIQQ